MLATPVNPVCVGEHAGEVRFRIFFACQIEVFAAHALQKCEFTKLFVWQQIGKLAWVYPDPSIELLDYFLALERGFRPALLILPRAHCRLLGIASGYHVHPSGKIRSSSKPWRLFSEQLQVLRACERSYPRCPERPGITGEDEVNVIQLGASPHETVLEVGLA